MSNSMEFPDVMVDLETGGTSPDRTPIIQIAAVRFNLTKQTVDSNTFEACLRVPPHRFWDESTRTWWLGQKPHILEDIINRARPYREVINEFYDWAVQTPSKHFWAKPISFDFAFLQSYFVDEQLPMPWSFRETMDVNTFIRSVHLPGAAPKLNIASGGDAHNALIDVFYQIELVCKHYQLTKGATNETQATHS